MRLARMLLIFAPLLLLIAAGYVGQMALQDAGPSRGRPVKLASVAVGGVKPPAPPLMEFKEISRETAIEQNAKVPFSKRPNPPARPFNFSGNDIDRARAVACLTAAAYYEAGNDLIGSSAVIQVVLNRMRHPAFPKSICAVVFQGSERKTGCQFTFTCDGALARIPDPRIWQRLSGLARLALNGFVYSPVGVATHYHTNWVVPYWSGSLEKNAQVGTHLFFRWPGWFGSPAAFAGSYVGGEVVADNRISQLVVAAPSEGVTVELTGASNDIPVRPTFSDLPANAADLQGSRVRFAAKASNVIMVQLEPQSFPGSYATMALALCKDKPVCEVWGWTNGRIVPQDQQLTAYARQSASFHFQKSLAQPNGIAQWNCAEFKRSRKDQCMEVAVPPKMEVEASMFGTLGD